MNKADSDAAIRLLELENEPAWVGLLETIDPGLTNAPWAAMLEQLKANGARSVLIEPHYLDRDYSAEYCAFYSRLYQRYSRHCQRLHFFRGHISSDLARNLDALVPRLRELNAANDYLGFVVIRPMPDAPIGRAVLATPAAPQGHMTRALVGAAHETHVIGVPLTIRGVPFTQQDTRLSACAQASIWMAGRHFSTKHGGPWFSTTAITEAASQPTDMMLASALPAGSSGLSPNNMLRALRAMERHPYAVMAVETPKGPIWPSLDPASILSRYVGSGIPVIAGLRPWRPSQRDGHAVVVIGDVFKPLEPAILSHSAPDASVLSPYFLVHDDQGGPALRMGVERGLPEAETEYNVREHVQFVIVPLPDKVFMPGEVAEVLAWVFLRTYISNWPYLKSTHRSEIGSSADLGDEIVAASQANQLLVKSYLTYSWRHKQRMLQSGAAKTLRDKIALFDLPRLIWVTEFARLQDVNFLDPDRRRIFGHCIFDATSTGSLRFPLLMHVPGLISTYRASPTEFFPEAGQVLEPVDDDGLYIGRVKPERGSR